MFQACCDDGRCLLEWLRASRKAAAVVKTFEWKFGRSSCLIDNFKIVEVKIRFGTVSEKSPRGLAVLIINSRV